MARVRLRDEEDAPAGWDAGSDGGQGGVVLGRGGVGEGYEHAVVVSEP